MKRMRFLLFPFAFLLIFILVSCNEDETDCGNNNFKFTYEFVNKHSLTSNAIQIAYSLYSNECNVAFFEDASTGDYPFDDVEKGESTRTTISTQFFSEKEFQLSSSVYSSNSQLTVTEGDLLRVVYENGTRTAYVYENGEGGDIGVGEEDCSEWIPMGGTCLDDNGERGVHFRICQLSETNTRVTVEAHAETINNGIDTDFYSEIKIRYGGETVFIPAEDFNESGFTSPSFTLEKEFYLPASEDVVWNDELKYHVGVATGRGYSELTLDLICNR